MRKSNSATLVLLTLWTFPTHRVSSRQETTGSEMLIAFLFSQLHFNNANLDAPFHGGHLVIRSAKPTIHLKKCLCIGNSMICSDIWHKYHE